MGQELSHASASEQLEADLGINGPFLIPSAANSGQSMQRVVCLIQQEWLSKQIKAKYVVAQRSASGRQLSSEEKTELLQPSHEHELNGWQRVNIAVIKKPLKRLRINNRGKQNGENYSFFEFLQHAAARDKADDEELLNARFKTLEIQKASHHEYLCEDTTKTIFEETCGIKVKEITNDLSSSHLLDTSLKEESGANVNTSSSKQSHFVPLLLACQNETFLYVIEPIPSHTLHDVLAFSPAIVSNSASKFMFLLYQILMIFSAVEAIGFTLSPLISFKDFYVTNSLWISISRFSIDESDVAPSEHNETATIIDSWLVETPKLLTPPVLCMENLQDYTSQWVDCKLTTFDYLMVLNTLAGRRMKDPAYYPIFPWVIDFTKADGGYRDFTKSKYRLCKSDAQLDITYNQPSSSVKDMIGSVPHHISHDPLTAITYYVYVSRRVSKEILCKHVRSRWVPDEYPSSMERLYAWTPEDCIPEFYSDPMIFRSIHADLPDLRIPSWTETPEDFIKYHRSVLESQYVSKNLNNWIDLVFGYKLSGMPSIDSKNVYLSLVDGHNHLTNCGVLQLFSRPHPTRKMQKLDEDVSFSKSYDNNEDSDNSSAFVQGERDDASVDGIICVAGKVAEEDVRTPRPAIRRDIWSVDSAIDEAFQIDEPQKVDDSEVETRHKPSITLLPPGLRMRIDTLLEGTGNDSKLPLPDDLKINADGCSNFIDGLEAIEKELKFQCHIAPADLHGVTRFTFGSVFDSKQQEKRISESGFNFPSNRGTMTLMNVLIELVLHEYVRLRTRKLTMVERLNENTMLMRAHLHRFPSWLLAILESWLKSSDNLSKDENDDEVTINKFLRHPGLLLCHHNNPFPYPKYFPSLHNLLTTLFDFTGSMYDSSAAVDKYSFSAISKDNSTPTIGNISRTAHLLPHLIEELDKEGIYLLLSFLLPLFSNPNTKLHAFLHFFHPLGSVMGFRSSLKYFFLELQQLYAAGSEVIPFESKLLDQIFISKIITVFGLNCFLECFLQYLVDGLMEISENEYSKEKNDNFDAEINDFHSKKPNAVYMEGTNEKVTDTIEDKESFKMEDGIPNDDAIPDRKASASFIEDEDNVNVLDPKPLSVKGLGESGVFTRLESILEEDNFRGRNASDDSNQDLPQEIDSMQQEIPEQIHDLNAASEDGLETVVEEEDDSKRHRFLKVLDKSEVIFNDSTYRKSHPLDDEQFETDYLQSEIGTKGISTPGSKSNVAHLSSSTGPSETVLRRRGRSSLSEAVQKSESEKQSHSSSSNSNETGESSSIDLNGDGLAVAIENFSIDSMCSEDDSKSFLIRRSNVKVRSHSNSSPFMVLHSDDDISDPENATEKPNDDNGIEDYANLQVDRIPGGEEFDSIAKCENNDEAVENDSSAEELALGCLKWIMPWLGPVLTSKYILKLILKKIPKVWLSIKYFEMPTTELIAAFKSKGKFLMDCLIEVVGIYGSAVVFHHLIPFASRAVAAALKAETVSTYIEGQLVSSTQILSRTLVYLSSENLAENMEILSQDIFEPSLRLLSSSKPFTGGSQVRLVLLFSIVDLLAILSQKLGQLDARDVMTPLLQRFFSCFDCVYCLERKNGSCNAIPRKYSFFISSSYSDDFISSLEQEMSSDDAAENGLAAGECRTEGQHKVAIDSANISQTMQENAIEKDAQGDGGPSIMSDLDYALDNQLTSKEPHFDNHSRVDSNGNENAKQMNEKTLKELNHYKELYDSFTPHLAHYSYVLFCRVLGDHFVSSILYNEDLIWQLCSNFDEGLTSKTQVTEANEKHADDNEVATDRKGQDEDKVKDPISESTKKLTRKRTHSENEEDTPVFRSVWQHIEGDWLQMWKERLDAKNDNAGLSFRGRRLQTYAGHSSAVRDIYIPNNEHYFLSASRDKTVKFWRLKNHGNGTAQIGCGKTYDKHSKPVFAVQSIESKRFAVSCDGTVHVWDPIKSETVSNIDLGKNHSVVSIRTLPVPSTTVAMASTEGTIRLYDVRQKYMCDEWKLVSNSAAGNVKCLCTNESGTWISAGFSNGFISVLDLRTGILRGQWRAHEAEILQIEAYNDHNFLSTSNDLRMKMWNEDGSLALRFKCPPEPIHCLSICNDQCMWATTNGNRIGITHHIANWANYESKKLPQDLFKGTISKLKVLPVNQLYLVGSENGNVVMFD